MPVGLFLLFAALSAILFAVLLFLPMENAMAVSTKRNALLNLFQGFSVRTLLGQLVDRKFRLRANDMVKVNNGRVRESTKRTVLRRFELHPQLAVVSPILGRKLLMLFFISLIPALICLFVLFSADCEILIRHLFNPLSPVKTMHPGPWIAGFEQLITTLNQAIGAGRVSGSVANNPGEIFTLGVLLPDGNHAFL